MIDSPAPAAGITDTFGIRSRPLVATMLVFAVVYVVVTVYSGATITSPVGWLGLAAAFGVFVCVGLVIIGVVDDPLPLRHTIFVAAGSVVAFALAVTSLPSPPDHVMQTGPPLGASVIMLAFLAVRGRPLAAWLASGAISVISTLWAAHAGMGAAWGFAITVSGYAIMIMGSLFSVMLRPMTREIYALRSANADRVAREAAVAATTDFREQQLMEFERRARPTLTAIIERREFSDSEVRDARLLEAQLRDGIRAPGLDDPVVRAAAWQARRRGVTVVLLDDGALVAATDGSTIGDRLNEVVVSALAQATAGRVTARVLPPGRDLLATITIDAADHAERIEVGLDGEVRTES
ncbi:hypothetical protein Gbro_3746 [Gordonia bronchialis DSM 43247]|uniref:Uncharacterized protein n=1 Tax=Gordonia bronchialis (strain ATCC 25592 / DSM 43247 / BCRC 13721 / JCM 3198 / KCTC 3076 / NBRC 16047 / NCTC 10667) TaxID=526226 RepID=D0L2M4_GORB4|nr:hypothetical protein [Gordonia bronchialis]ACY22927.1 hypothetical protein Gbro_3746 [Gordonia bronchialis DSM 43247]MCC3325706.1 hypothetical protein [Gordonia bronchialis]QGS23638.1 hypothetical protein FOB84_05065 [Gordonia bronchialis]STQ65875.1 Uncharacterised protein [Gordonia bronchialis]